MVGASSNGHNVRPVAHIALTRTVLAACNARPVGPHAYRVRRARGNSHDVGPATYVALPGAIASACNARAVIVNAHGVIIPRRNGNHPPRPRPRECPPHSQPRRSNSHNARANESTSRKAVSHAQPGITHAFATTARTYPSAACFHTGQPRLQILAHFGGSRVSLSRIRLACPAHYTAKLLIGVDGQRQRLSHKPSLFRLLRVVVTGRQRRQRHKR